VADLSFGGPPPGEQLPDFDLPTTSGDRICKADFIDRRPLLLMCGSITCPMTASSDRDLARLNADFGHAVAFVTLNVRASPCSPLGSGRRATSGERG
jgi:hypothetical protein